LSSVDLLQVTPAAREAIDIVLDGSELEGETRETWRELGQVAVGTLPEWARQQYGYAMPPPEAMERETVRQLLGVLDLGYESLPAVRGAGQRMELRRRG